jgi:hypothetical protein
MGRGQRLGFQSSALSLPSLTGVGEKVGLLLAAQLWVLLSLVQARLWTAPSNPTQHWFCCWAEGGRKRIYQLVEDSPLPKADLSSYHGHPPSAHGAHLIDLDILAQIWMDLAALKTKGQERRKSNFLSG